MSVSSSTAPLAAPAGNLRAEQLYATHCLKSDSVEGQAGFSVRAISGQATAWTGFARDFPSLKVPLDMTGTELLPRQAPRRLALVKAPGGKAALIHSSYLPKDTLGRSLNYFTHVLIYDRIPPRLALRAWGASTWKTAYPEGATQGLEPFSGVPDGGLINDEALAVFLSDPVAPANQDLATMLYPARVQGDLERHRRWLRAALQGFLLAHSQPGSGRSRLYILAEPGLVALLTYAIARLLPDTLTEGLTFSTFESSHGSLREFQDAQVIGTYLSNTQRGLEIDYLNRRGFGVDTFLNKFSPELSADGPHPLDRLIAMAARRGWAEIDELHGFWRYAEPSIAGLEEVLRVQEPARRLRQNTSWDIADLLTLQASALGRALLQGPEFRDQLWPQVRKWSSRRDVIQAFAPLFRDPSHLADLKAEARTALEAGSLTDWQKRWEVIQGVLPPDEAAGHFADIVNMAGRGQGTALAFPTRLALLRQWQAIEPRREEVPAASAWLLDCAGATDWQALTQAALPARWVGQALCRALAGNAPDDAALVLQRGDDSLFRGFCQALCTDRARDQALTHLLDPQQKAAPALFPRLWKNGLDLDEPTLDALLVRVKAESKAWNDFWKANDHLVLVLKRTIPAGPFAQLLWKRCTDRLTPACLLGDATHQGYLAFLQKALTALDQRVPAEAATAVRDWTLLAQHLSQPGTTAPDALRVSCQRRGIGAPDALLAPYLSALIQSAGGALVGVGTLNPLLQSARKFYVTDHDALDGWLKVVETSAARAQAGHYQAEFVRATLDPQQWSRLASVFEQSLQPEVRNFMQKRASAPSPKAAPRTTGPAAKSGAKASGAKSINVALIATAAVLTIALLAVTIVWLQDRDEKASVLKDLNYTKAKLEDVRKDQFAVRSKYDKAKEAQEKAKDAQEKAESALKNKDAKASDAEKKRKDAEGKLNTEIQAKLKAQEELTKAKDELKAMQAQGNGRSTKVVVAPPPEGPKTPDHPQPEGDWRRKVMDLYRYHIAWANRELLNNNPEGIKKALAAFQDEAKKIQPDNLKQVWPTASDPWPYDWQWEALQKLTQSDTPPLLVDTPEIRDMAFIRSAGVPALVWANLKEVKWINLSGGLAKTPAQDVIGNTDLNTLSVSRVYSDDNGDTFALVKTGEFTLWSSDNFKLKFPFLKPPDAAIQQFALSATAKRSAAVIVPTRNPQAYIHIWEVDSKKPDTLLQRDVGNLLEDKGNDVSALAFSPDEGRLAFGMKNGIVKTWVLTEDRPRIFVNRPHTTAPASVSSLAFGPEGQMLAIATDREVEVCFLNEKKEPLLLPYGGFYSNRCVAFSATRGLLASSGDGKTVYLWDAATGRRLLTLPSEALVWNLKFSPDGNWLAAVQGGTRQKADPKSTIKLWDLSAPTQKKPAP